jgi:hypothetical protein
VSEPTIKTTDTGYEVVGAGVHTMPELLELAKVDTTRWQVASQKIKRWDVTRAGGVESRWMIGAQLVPAPEVVSLKDEILAEIRAASPKVPPMKHTLTGDSRYMLEIAPMDLHLGLRAWARDAGAHYDIKTACNLFMWAVDELCSRTAAFPIEQVLFVLGNDFLHVDTKQSTTTKGTPQDVDAQPLEMFKVGRALLTQAILRMKQVAPVRVLAIPGNHDFLTVLHLAEVIDAQFYGDPDVSVNAGPETRKYHRYGNTLLGFTHGDQVKADKLPLLMAQEVPHSWSETRFREWHLGHYHRVRTEEHNGVRVRVLPSMVAEDAWHSEKGYSHVRAAEAYLWEKQVGYSAHFSANVPEGA